MFFHSFIHVIVNFSYFHLRPFSHSSPSSSESLFFPTSLPLLSCLPVRDSLDLSFLPKYGVGYVQGHQPSISGYIIEEMALLQQPLTSPWYSGGSRASRASPPVTQCWQPWSVERSCADSHCCGGFMSGRLRILIPIPSLSFCRCDVDDPFRADPSTITYSWHLGQLWVFLINCVTHYDNKSFCGKTKRSTPLKIETWALEGSLGELERWFSR